MLQTEFKSARAVIVEEKIRVVFRYSMVNFRKIFGGGGTRDAICNKRNWITITETLKLLQHFFYNSFHINILHLSPFISSRKITFQFVAIALASTRACKRYVISFVFALCSGFLTQRDESLRRALIVDDALTFNGTSRIFHVKKEKKKKKKTPRPSSRKVFPSMVTTRHAFKDPLVLQIKDEIFLSANGKEIRCLECISTKHH